MILAAGLVSVASIFSTVIGINIRNQQRTTATLLLYDKMEQLRSRPSPVGGGLELANPAAGFSEYIRISADGTILFDNSPSSATYIRLWQVVDTKPQVATVVVFARFVPHPPIEFARATTLR